jgi:hypothetical protein
MVIISGGMIQGRARAGVTGDHMDERLMKIRDAYEEAGREQPSEYPPLPAWEALSQELREAIIHVYYRGRFEALPRDAEPK